MLELGTGESIESLACNAYLSGDLFEGWKLTDVPLLFLAGVAAVNAFGLFSIPFLSLLSFVFLELPWVLEFSSSKTPFFLSKSINFLSFLNSSS